MCSFSGVDLADVLEHHDGAEEEAGWICDVFACHVGSGSVDGFEHGVVCSNVGGAGEADGACDLGSDVAYDVAVEVFGYDDIKSFGNVGEFCCTDIDYVVIFFNIRVLMADFVEDRVEESIGHLHYVVFAEAGDFFSIIEFGVFKGVSNDAFAAWA